MMAGTLVGGNWAACHDVARVRAAAGAAARLLRGLLYQIRPTDPTAIAGALVLLATIAIVATLLPVRRALRIDPMEALRAE